MDSSLLLFTVVVFGHLSAMEGEQEKIEREKELIPNKMNLLLLLLLFSCVLFCM